tara:strand:- start:1231 stop:2766 length:1536 start_codon:yes stop_codon:yes gene_type:complete
MANWKKVVVSGSQAELRNITASGNISASEVTASAGIKATLPNVESSKYVVVNSYGDFGQQSLPTIPAAANDATITLTARDGLKTGGSFTTNQSSDEEIFFDIDVGVIAGVGLTADNTNEELDVSAAQTGITSVLNTSLVVGRDADNQIKFGTDNNIIFEVDGVDEITFGKGGHITSSGNITASGNIQATGNIVAEEIRAANGLVGTISTVAQPNITSLGTLTTLNTSGAITASGTISASSFKASGVSQITASLVNSLEGATLADGKIIVGSISGKAEAQSITGVIGITRGGVTTFVNNSVTKEAINTGVAGNGLSGGNGTALSVDYGSNANDAVEGNTTISITGTTNEVEITGTTAQALGGGPSYTIGLPDDVTIGGDLTVTGDLVVSGDTTQLNVTNLAVDDQFILLKSGSDSGDGGIIVQTTGNSGTPAGAGLGYDDSLSRWVLTGADLLDYSDTAFTVKAAGAAQMIVAVSQSSGAPTGNPTDLGGDAASRRGLMFVDTSTEDIYIFS